MSIHPKDKIQGLLFRRILSRIAENHGLEAFLQAGLEVLCSETGTEAGSILLRHKGGKGLYFAAVVGEAAPKLKTRTIPEDLGLVGKCIRTGKKIVACDPAKDPDFYREFAEKIGFPTRNLLAVPLKVSGRVVGALELLNWKGRALSEARVQKTDAFLGILTDILKKADGARS